MFFNFDSFSVVTGLVSIHDIMYIKYMASSPSILYIIFCDQPQQTSRPVPTRPDQTRRRGQSDGWTWPVDWKGHLDYYIIILNRIALHSMLNCCVSASACADSTKPNPRTLWLNDCPQSILSALLYPLSTYSSSSFFRGRWWWWILSDLSISLVINYADTLRSES